MSFYKKLFSFLFVFYFIFSLGIASPAQDYDQALETLRKEKGIKDRGNNVFVSVLSQLKGKYKDQDSARFFFINCYQGSAQLGGEKPGADDFETAVHVFSYCSTQSVENFQTFLTNHYSNDQHYLVKELLPFDWDPSKKLSLMAKRQIDQIEYFIAGYDSNQNGVFLRAMENLGKDEKIFKDLCLFNCSQISSKLPPKGQRIGQALSKERAIGFKPDIAYYDRIKNPSNPRESLLDVIVNEINTGIITPSPQGAPNRGGESQDYDKIVQRFRCDDQGTSYVSYKMLRYVDNEHYELALDQFPPVNNISHKSLHVFDAKLLGPKPGKKAKNKTRKKLTIALCINDIRTLHNKGEVFSNDRKGKANAATAKNTFQALVTKLKDLSIEDYLFFLEEMDADGTLALTALGGQSLHQVILAHHRENRAQTIEEEIKKLAKNHSLRVAFADADKAGAPQPMEHNTSKKAKKPKKKKVSPTPGEKPREITELKAEEPDSREAATPRADTSPVDNTMVGPTSPGESAETKEETPEEETSVSTVEAPEPLVTEENHDELETLIEETQEHSSLAMDELVKAKEENEQLSKQLQDVYGKLRDLQKQYNDGVVLFNRQKEEGLATLGQTIMTGQILWANHKDLQQHYQTLSGHYEALHNQCQAIYQENIEYKGVVETLGNETTRLSQVISGLYAEQERNRDERANLCKTNESLKAINESFRLQVAGLYESINDPSKQLDHLKKEKAQMVKDMEASQVKIQELETSNKALEDKNKDLGKTIAHQQKIIRETNVNKIDVLGKKVSELETKIFNQRKKNKELEFVIQNASNIPTNTQLVRDLRRELRESRKACKTYSNRMKELEKQINERDQLAQASSPTPGDSTEMENLRKQLVENQSLIDQLKRDSESRESSHAEEIANLKKELAESKERCATYSNRIKELEVIISKPKEKDSFQSQEITRPIEEVESKPSIDTEMVKNLNKQLRNRKNAFKVKSKFNVALQKENRKLRAELAENKLVMDQLTSNLDLLSKQSDESQAFDAERNKRLVELTQTNEDQKGQLAQKDQALKLVQEENQALKQSLAAEVQKALDVERAKFAAEMEAFKQSLADKAQRELEEERKKHAGELTALNQQHAKEIQAKNEEIQTLEVTLQEMAEIDA